MPPTLAVKVEITTDENGDGQSAPLGFPTTDVVEVPATVVPEQGETPGYGDVTLEPAGEHDERTVFLVHGGPPQTPLEFEVEIADPSADGAGDESLEGAGGGTTDDEIPEPSLHAGVHQDNVSEPGVEHTHYPSGETSSHDRRTADGHPADPEGEPDPEAE